VRAHVLLVEDDVECAVQTAHVLGDLARVDHVRSDDAALARLAIVLPDLVVTDLRGVAPGGSPVDYVASLAVRLDALARGVRARTPAVVLASALDPDVLRAIASTVVLVPVIPLPKPYSPRALRELVTRLTAPAPA